MKSATWKKFLALGAFAGIVVIAVVAAFCLHRSSLRKQLPDGSWMEIVYIGYGHRHFIKKSYQQGLGERVFRRLPESWHLLLRDHLPERWQKWTYSDIDYQIDSENPILLVVALTNCQPGSMGVNMWAGKMGHVDMIVNNEQGHTYGIAHEIRRPPFRPGCLTQLEWFMEEKIDHDPQRLILRLYETKEDLIVDPPLTEFVIDNPAYAGGR